MPIQLPLIFPVLMVLFMLAMERLETVVLPRCDIIHPPPRPETAAPTRSPQVPMADPGKTGRT